MFVGINLGINQLRSSVSFSPAVLFALGEPGVWFDPSDVATLFQDPAGTTPVTTPGQTVGLMLDKSKGLALGADTVVNGNFAGGTTGWTISGGTTAVNGSGQIVITVTGSAAFLSQSFTTVIGRTYKVTGDIIGSTGSPAFFGIRKADEATPATNVVNIRTSAGSADGVFVATATTSFVVLQVNNAGCTATFDNISVRELPGNHATQATLAARPTYSIEPVGGRRNLLLSTEDFSNAAWSKIAVNTPTNTTATTDPAGGLTADILTENNGTAEHHVAQSFVKSASSIAMTATVYVKRATSGTRNVAVAITDGTTGGYAAIFDPDDGSVVLASQVVGTATGWTAGTPTSADAGNGWWRLSFPVTTNTAARADIVVYLVSGTTRTYLGDNASNIYLWGAQLELGSTATNYQKVTTTYDVTEAGVASMSYLYFDGVNDAMVTSTITPGIDKAQVFAGVRKLSDAAIGIILESSLNWFDYNGAVALAAPNSVAANFGWNSRGNLSVIGTTANSFPAPTTQVLSGVSSISEDILRLRQNGVQTLNVTSDQGTGNYLAYPLYIGARGGTTLPFSGHIYSLITRFGANLDTPTIASTETWVAGKTGFYTPVITGVPTIGVS